jgi:serine/threonine-protein kinase
MATSGVLAGRTIGCRYEVLDLLGSGGMGEVYRARDRELDDLIALKVVRQDLLAYPGVLERFRKEVKLARRVTHPNVARAFDLVIAEGMTFYTMELVDGVPLSSRMRSARPFPVGEAAAIVIALCDVLTAAHGAGVVHRDVKPANVLLGDDGRIILTDFGVAALAQQELGELEGTPRYMAPEQALGQAATPAADLYALGVVLFEILAGVPGFDGSVAEVLEAKQRIEHLDVEADPRLVELVASATHRDPARRPHSAQSFRRALAPFARPTTRTRATEASIHRLPPLPTVIVRSPTAQTNVHLAEGFHQALVDRLVEWPRLRVVPHDVASHAGGVLVDLAVVDDDAELTATARQMAIAIRFPLDVETLCESVEQVARIVAVLAGSDAAPPAQRRRTLPAALDLILRARHDARRDRTVLADCVHCCERALALAPGDARVLAALATCEAQLAFHDASDPAGVLAAANRHALAALAADPECGEAHVARGHIELHAGRPVIAATCFRGAIARAPMLSEAHEWLGRLLLEAGFVVDAVARLDDAFAMGPLPILRWSTVLAHALDLRWDEVDRGIDELRDVGADARGYMLRIAAWRGDRAAELAAHAELARTAASTFEHLVLAVYDPTRPWSSRREAILAMADTRHVIGARRRAFIAQLAAEAAGRGGDVETCLAMLLRASNEGLFHLHWLDRCPFLDQVRAESRFAVIRADVAARAEAIQDALFSDRLDQAEMATAAAPSSRS